VIWSIIEIETKPIIMTAENINTSFYDIVIRYI
jgi:hypothetical protein